MKKVNKLLFGILGLFVIFIVGCVTTTETPKYLEFSENSNPIIRTGENYNLRFFVINPTQNTFTGELEYQYDNRCIWTSGSDEVEITPKEYREAIVKSFSNSGRSNDETCFQTPIKITTILKDKGGEPKGKFDVLLTIVR